nr:unnamed protein product [Callosobruchus analis]
MFTVCLPPRLQFKIVESVRSAQQLCLFYVINRLLSPRSCSVPLSSWPENTRKTRTIRASGSFGYLRRTGISTRRTNTTCLIAGKIRQPG